MSVNWNALPREEMLPYLEKSNWAAARMLAFNWGLIAASFALVIAAPHWTTVIAAMLVLGGRQLGLGILTHECAHRSLVKSAALGDWIGNWLCGAPMLVDLAIYRRYHMTHHVKAGTDGDPDLANYANYPVSRRSLLRKLARDLTGLSGLRAALAIMVLYGQEDASQMLQGYSYANKGAGKQAAKPSPRLMLWNARRSLIANAAMLGVCWLLGHPLAYLLWPASWLTTYMLYSRIRNAAEHGALAGTQSDDVWRNTRSVEATWWERLTVAPNYVNFHFEHHLAPTVPCYRLPALHRRLLELGVFERAPLEHGYLHVLRRMTAA